MTYNMIFLMVLFHYAHHLYFYFSFSMRYRTWFSSLIKEYDSVVKKGIWFTWKESVYNMIYNRRISFTIWFTIWFSSWFLFHYARHLYFYFSFSIRYRTWFSSLIKEYDSVLKKGYDLHEKNLFTLWFTIKEFHLPYDLQLNSIMGFTSLCPSSLFCLLFLQCCCKISSWQTNGWNR